MKKVVYSIKKVRNPDEKLSGLGFINDEGTCALILNNSVLVTVTCSYAKTVVTNHFYRFWFQFNASHSVLLLLSPVI